MSQSPTPMRDDLQAYNEAMRMLRYEGTSTWQRFGAFLVAHGLLVGLMIRYGLHASGRPNHPAILMAAAWLGLLMSFAWWSAFERSTAFFDLRVSQARRFEPMAWGFLREGELLISQGYLDLPAREPVKMARAAKYQLRAWPRALIASFALFYVFLIWYCALDHRHVGWWLVSPCLATLIAAAAVVHLSRRIRPTSAPAENNAVRGSRPADG